MSADDQKLHSCISCRLEGKFCQPGFRLMESLRLAVQCAVPVTGEGFEISGTAHLEGCSRPCSAAFRASKSETYLFGGVAPDAGIDELVSMAKDHGALEERPGRQERLRKELAARLPAAMIVTRTDGTAFS